MNKKQIILIRNAKSYDFGGGERFPVFLAEILQKNGIEPLIVSRSTKLLAFAADSHIPTLQGWWWSQQNWSGVRVILLPIYILWQCLLFVWYTRLFIRYKPTAVHVQSKDDFIAATFAAKLCHARVIWTDHADLKHIWKNIGVWYKNPVGKIVSFAARFANCITVVSESERMLVSAELANSSIVTKLKVVYNGVIDQKNNYAAMAHSPIFTFCVASRLVTDKGISEAITAFTQLQNEFHDCQLQLLGDGPEATHFKKQASHSSKIAFLGHQTNPLNYIASADVFVHPTYHEGFSVALVEASMLGRPIIATSVGGNVEIIYDSKTGLLVPPKNSQALYLAMKLLYSDSALRKQLGSAARRQYEQRFNFDMIVRNEFIPLYIGAK